MPFIKRNLTPRGFSILKAIYELGGEGNRKAIFNKIAVEDKEMYDITMLKLHFQLVRWSSVGFLARKYMSRNSRCKIVMINGKKIPIYNQVYMLKKGINIRFANIISQYGELKYVETQNYSGINYDNSNKLG